ncbi:MAG TPA: N-acetylmuramic acid 6-phosphate etherase, partial [Methylomirabilota bacterium]|nr:N-acetylmuramic acid 6-phosphate etherase [Methylomirabilota bacterium]
LVRQLGRVSPREAERLLRAAGGSAKLAIAMARLRIDAAEARRRLKHAAGSLRRVIDGVRT